VQALTEVELEVHAGEVVALVGDNGAGKSTLVKTIAGVHPIDEGAIEWEGRAVRINRPQDAQHLGVATAYQDLALADNLDVVGNLFLGRELKRRGTLDEVAMEQKARELLDTLSIRIPSVRIPVASLSGGQRQVVAIARSLIGDPKIVILDEPTAALGVEQTAQVLDLVERLRARPRRSPDQPQHGRRPRRRGHRHGAAPREEQRHLPGEGDHAGDHHRRHHRRHRQRGDPARGAHGGGCVMSNDIETSVATASSAPAPAADPRLLQRGEGFAGYWGEFVRKVRGGDLGSLPVIIGLAAIWIVFGVLDGQYFHASNAEFIAYYMAGLGLLSMGLVFVLLLGEIDLSVGSVSGLSAAVYAVLSVEHGLNPWLAVLLTLLTGAGIGALHGWIFAKIGVPAFVVTLAGFLAWQGVMLWLLGGTGTINLSDKGLNHFLSGNSFFLGGDISGGYILAALATGATLLGGLREQARRRKAGVPYRATGEIVLRTALLAVASFGVAYVLNLATGVPNALVLFLALLIVADFVLRRTSFGRKIFAVGGNIEASRRAGISVPAIRIAVYSISGTFAALGGLAIAGTTNAAGQAGADPNNLILAIAAAVIGGTSLFGGRGRIWSALLGVLVIESINAGLYLLGLTLDIQYAITGAVLLAAVVVDSLSRRTQKSSGRG
jgi:D-xylose transport system permease protein